MWKTYRILTDEQRRASKFICYVFLVALVFVVFVTYLSVRPITPFFKGRTFGLWLNDIDSNVPEKRAVAEDAFKKTGTKVLPALIKIVSSKDSPSEWDRRHGRQDKQHQRANLALKILGQPALPELAKLLEDPATRWNSARALATFGQIGVPALTNALNSRDAEIRMTAASALAKMGQEARDAVPTLLLTLKDKSSEVRAASANALRFIHIRVVHFNGTAGNPKDNQVEFVVPALTELVRDPVTDVRVMAVCVLGNFREDAISSVSNLLEALKDKDPDVRRYAAWSLNEITNATNQSLPRSTQ